LLKVGRGPRGSGMPLLADVCPGLWRGVARAVAAVRASLGSAVEPGGPEEGSVAHGGVRPGRGLEVVLHSLAAAELNGRRGTLASDIANERGRWEVLLPQESGDGRTLGLKLSNLAWPGRRVLLGDSPSAPEFVGSAGLLTDAPPDSNGRWTVEASRVLALKPGNLEVLPETAGGTLRRGCRISVSGLQSAAGYNGLTGMVLSKGPNEQGRWEVEVTAPVPVALESLKLELLWAAELFGELLQTRAGPMPTVDVLAGKRAVLVYFSAHWCPPCRGFTPVMAAAYKRSRSQSVEVVFVSSDHNAAGFDAYFGEMPWTALPFCDRERHQALSLKFGVRGIPSLVVLRGTDGSVAWMNGRDQVQATGDLDACLVRWGC